MNSALLDWLLMLVMWLLLGYCAAEAILPLYDEQFHCRMRAGIPDDQERKRAQRKTTLLFAAVVVFIRICVRLNTQ